MKGVITERKSHINASDVAIIMNMNYSLVENKRGEHVKEYDKTKLRLYNEKHGLIDIDAILDDISQSRLERMQLGNDFEPIAFEHYKRTLDKGLKAKWQPGKILNEKYPWLCGHPDGLVYDKTGVLLNGWEHKLVGGLTDYYQYDDFIKWVQTDHTNHYVQVQTYELLSGVEFDLCYTVINGNKYEKLAPIRIPHDKKFQDLIIKSTKNFWYYYIIGNQIRMKMNEKRELENRPLIEIPLPVEEVRPYDYSMSEGVHELNSRQYRTLVKIINLKEKKKQIEDDIDTHRKALETELDAIDKNLFIKKNYEVKKTKIKSRNKLDMDLVIAKNKGIKLDGCYIKGDASKRWDYNKRQEV